MKFTRKKEISPNRTPFLFYIGIYSVIALHIFAIWYVFFSEVSDIDIINDQGLFRAVDNQLRESPYEVELRDSTPEINEVAMNYDRARRMLYKNGQEDLMQTLEKPYQSMPVGVVTLTEKNGEYFSDILYEGAINTFYNPLTGEDNIYFFTKDGAYIEWDGGYRISDGPYVQVPIMQFDYKNLHATPLGKYFNFE